MPTGIDLASNGAGRGAWDDCCLGRRLEIARATLANCTFCERRCRVNRLAGQVGPCGLGLDTYCLKRYLSLANDLDIVPALRVYLAGCNLRCRFCSGPEAFEPAAGERIHPAQFAAQLESAVQRNVKTIQLIGGEPSLHPHTILAIVAAAAQPLPLLLDTNLYMTPLVLELLDGVIRTYSANLKFGNDRCAWDLAGAERYVDVVMRNLRMLAGRVDLRIRYLLLPGHVECCLEPLVRRLSDELPGSRFDLLTYKEQEVETTTPCCRLRRLTAKPGIPTANRAAGRVFCRFQPSLPATSPARSPEGPVDLHLIRRIERSSSCTYRELRQPDGSMQIIRG